MYVLKYSLKKLCQFTVGVHSDKIGTKFNGVRMMTFKQFKYLSEDDQEMILWRKGVEIGRKREGRYHYILFQVDGFYLEVKYTMPHRTIVQIACFEDPYYLEPYLRSIDIAWLYAA